MVEVWHTAAELAAMRLPGLPASPQGVNAKAKRDGWTAQRRDGSAQAWEYPISALPPAARKAISAKALAHAKPQQLALDLPAISDLKHYQRGPMEARAALLAEIDRQMLMGHTLTDAITTMVSMAAQGTLSPELQRLVPIANARSGEGRALSVRTLKRWRSDREKGGGNPVALATAAVPESPLQPWAPTFMRLYGRPTKPGIPEVLEDWPKGEAKPSEHQCRRFLRKLDAISRNMGRMGARALKSIKAYVARDVSELWPGAVFIGDGHTYKQEVAHPIHGQPFRPEVTVMLDVFTRKWVGWSAAL
ncbi:MAG: hypothetical protein HY055_15850, partial [Magnetospirillum sp.]|nr:hypothetical protein [Magnetospirillum sp.]